MSPCALEQVGISTSNFDPRSRRNFMAAPVDGMSGHVMPEVHFPIDGKKRPIFLPPQTQARTEFTQLMQHTKRMHATHAQGSTRSVALVSCWAALLREAKFGSTRHF